MARRLYVYSLAMEPEKHRGQSLGVGYLQGKDSRQALSRSRRRLLRVENNHRIPSSLADIGNKSLSRLKGGTVLLLALLALVVGPHLVSVTPSACAYSRRWAKMLHRGLVECHKPQVEGRRSKAIGYQLLATG
jgi:hypothetical protein